jgi:serine/threonine-protein kinase
MLLNNYARNLLDLHRFPEARDYAERANAAARRAGDEIVVTHALFLRASLYRQQADFEGARRCLAELEGRLERDHPPGHFYFAVLESERGLLAEARGELRDARAAQDRALALAEAGEGDPTFVALVLARRAALALASGQQEAARADAARALELERETAEPDARSSWTGRASLILGRALEAGGRLAEAHAAFTEALAHLEPALGADHPETQNARRLVLATRAGSGP